MVTDTELNINVAEWLGWTNVRVVSQAADEGTQYELLMGAKPDSTWGWSEVPNFANDLNAWNAHIWPKLKDATAPLVMRWLDELQENLGQYAKWRFVGERQSQVALINSTARQRCEALLIACQSHS